MQVLIANYDKIKVLANFEDSISGTLMARPFKYLL